MPTSNSRPTAHLANLFANLPDTSKDEVFTELLRSPSIRLERIVSKGQATPDGEWYDQEQGEWVILLEGGAGLLFEGEDAPRTLTPGDYVYIPPHVRHRVTWTENEKETVWLALFLDGHGVVQG